MSSLRMLSLLPDTLTGWGVAVLVLGLLYAVYKSFLFPPKLMTSRNFYDHNSKRVLERKRSVFPPSYPNGWFRIAASVDVDNGKVKSISALGQELVAFRGKGGKVGVLHAYCPPVLTTQQSKADHFVSSVFVVQYWRSPFEH